MSAEYTLFMFEGLNIPDQGYNWQDKIIFTNAKRQVRNTGLVFVRAPEHTKTVELFETPLRIAMLFLTCYQLINQSNPRILYPTVSISHTSKDGKPNFEFMLRQPLPIDVPDSGFPILKEEVIVTNLNKTTPLFEKVMTAVEKKSAASLEIALIMYYRSLHTMESIEDFLVLVTALEALYSESTSELRYKIALRGAIMIRNYFTDTRQTFENLKDIYDIRSKLIHGGFMPKLFTSELIKYKMKLYPILKYSLLNYIEQAAKGKKKEDIIRELDDLALGSLSK